MELISKLRTFKPFTEREAWMLFKYAAIGEAVGWTLLISGITINRYNLPGHPYAVLIAGQIHGMLFAFYLAIVLASFNSLGWSFKKSAIAVLVSVPPYGTLVFEQWALRTRRKALRQTYTPIVVRAIIARGDAILAIQPDDSARYRLPGGYMKEDETAEQSIGRIIFDLTGIAARVGRLKFSRKSDDMDKECLELCFAIINSKDYHGLDLERVRKSHTDIDVIRFVSSESALNVATAVAYAG